MKALILNSGLGSRMGVITNEHPKCMTEISFKNTILSRQLRMLASFGVEEVVMTTGYYDKVLVDYCNALHLPLKYTFVNNPLYDKTNYIYSIYCAKDALKDDDIILMHGDLVFESRVMEAVIDNENSCMVVSSTLPLPEKDFKAVIRDGRIEKVGINFFDNAMAAQPLYKIKKEDWLVWLANIEKFCENDNRKVYAENAFNEVSDKCKIYPCDVQDMLCSEIDTPEDLKVVSQKVAEVNERTVYMCFSTEYIHSGHVAIINKARRLGRLIIGVLSDEAISSFKRYPLIPFAERKALFENMAGSCAIPFIIFCIELLL
jgi:cytidyltransferase-like protein